MSSLTLRNLENELIDQLDAIAAENGQNIEVFVQSALTQLVNNHAALRETGLGSRIAARVRGIGFKDNEALAEFPRQGIRNPFGEEP